RAVPGALHSLAHGRGRFRVPATLDPAAFANPNIRLQVIPHVVHKKQPDAFDRAYSAFFSPRQEEFFNFGRIFVHCVPRTHPNISDETKEARCA
ncbi:MAG: hypothetical protein L5657_08450, partial [Calditerricola sp.]|nr:hypothetical protein [Calditerricola sp.]